MSSLWTGLGISFMALPFILAKVAWSYAFPIYILFYATGTFISGGLLQFKPLQIGGIICWMLAIAATFELSKSNTAECHRHPGKLSYSGLFVKKY
jgi:hypothetical protein